LEFLVKFKHNNMLITAFIKIANAVMSFISLFFQTPEEFPTQIHTAAQAAGAQLNLISPMVDIDQLQLGVSFIIALEIAIAFFYIMIYVWSHVPIFGAKQIQK